MEPTNNNQNRQHQNVEDQGQLPQRDRSGVEDVAMNSRERETSRESHRDGDTGNPPADEQSKSTENDDAIADETDDEFEEDDNEEDEDDDLDSEKAGE